jgi:nitrite reductase/ring-hydroxylating ferredoxin subunit
MDAAGVDETATPARRIGSTVSRAWRSLSRGSDPTDPPGPSAGLGAPRAGHSWVALCDRAGLSEGRGQSVIAAGLTVAVFVDDGEVYAVENECPHYGVPLDDGLVDDGCVVCPWHSWRFDLATGDHVTTFGRRSGLMSYPVTVAGGTVWIQVREQVPSRPAARF